MAQTTETITFTCGHTARVQVRHGNASERDRKIAWMGETLTCPECRETEAAARRAEIAAASTFTGSVKQVAWAEDIAAEQRAEWAKDLANLNTRLAEIREAHPEAADAEAAKLAAVIEAADKILARTSAREWIDTRGTSISLLAQEVARIHATAPTRPGRKLRIGK